MLIQAVVLGIQARRLRQTVGQMRKAEQRQVRGYISAYCKHIYSFDENKLAEAKVEIENVGLTPAHEMNHHGDIIIAPHPLPEGYEFPSLATPMSNAVVVFPRSKFDGTIVASAKFGKTEIAAVINGNARVYIYGEIFYEDVFGIEDRNTCFAFSVVANKETIQKLASNHQKADLTITFIAAPAGNTAT
jgi:hypothetical protein